MRFLEFFAANIRNPHTRRAYAVLANDKTAAGLLSQIATQLARSHLPDGLRQDAITAPFVIDRAMTRAIFVEYLASFPPCARATSSSWTICRRTRAQECARSSRRRARAALPAALLTQPQPDRAGLLCAKPRSARSTFSGQRIDKLLDLFQTGE